MAGSAVRLAVVAVTVVGVSSGCSQWSSLTSNRQAWMPRLPFVGSGRNAELPPVADSPQSQTAASNVAATAPAAPSLAAPSTAVAQSSFTAPSEGSDEVAQAEGRQVSLASMIRGSGSKAFGGMRSWFGGSSDERDDLASTADAPPASGVAAANQPNATSGQQPSGSSAPAEYHLSLARAYERVGNLDGAKQQYELALGQDSRNVGAALGLARLHDRAGRLIEAGRFYQQAASLDPRSATAWNDLALCQVRQGRAADAAGSMQQAVRLNPEKKLYRNNMAKILIDLDQTDAALAQLSAVHAPAAAHYNLGYLLTQNEARRSLATGHFAKALQLDPTMSDAQRWLDSLQTPPLPAASTVGNLDAPATVDPYAMPPANSQQPAYETSMSPSGYYPPSRF